MAFFTLSKDDVLRHGTVHVGGELIYEGPINDATVSQFNHMFPAALLRIRSDYSTPPEERIKEPLDTSKSSSENSPTIRQKPVFTIV